MQMFLGETAEFWIRVRAAMRKAKIDTADDLEARLGVTPPTYEVVERDDHQFSVVERRQTFGQEKIVGWGATRPDAERIALSLASGRMTFDG